MTQNDGIIREYFFNSSNVLQEVTEQINGVEKKAKYTYNGFGHCISQVIHGPEDPETIIRYTIDVIRPYYNTLAESIDSENYTQRSNFYYDYNVVAMQRASGFNYYMQDDLGSPIALYNQNREKNTISNSFEQAINKGDVKDLPHKMLKKAADLAHNVEHKVISIDNYIKKCDRYYRSAMTRSRNFGTKVHVKTIKNGIISQGSEKIKDEWKGWAIDYFDIPVLSINFEEELNNGLNCFVDYVDRRIRNAV